MENPQLLKSDPRLADCGLIGQGQDAVVQDKSFNRQSSGASINTSSQQQLTRRMKQQDLLYQRLLHQTEPQKWQRVQKYSSTHRGRGNCGTESQFLPSSRDVGQSKSSEGGYHTEIPPTRRAAPEMPYYDGMQYTQLVNVESSTGSAFASSRVCDVLGQTRSILTKQSQGNSTNSHRRHVGHPGSAAATSSRFSSQLALELQMQQAARQGADGSSAEDFERELMRNNAEFERQ